MLIVQHTEDTGESLGYPSGNLYYFKISYFDEANTIQNDNIRINQINEYPYKEVDLIYYINQQ